MISQLCTKIGEGKAEMKQNQNRFYSVSFWTIDAYTLTSFTSFLTSLKKFFKFELCFKWEENITFYQKVFTQKSEKRESEHNNDASSTKAKQKQNEIE